MRAIESAPISEREGEVLAAIGAHLSNAQIATRLHLSVRTVESHVSSLLRKLAAADRHELADIAPQLGVRAPTAGVACVPAPWTTFVGRKREIEATASALAEDRLVTLVGPGGVGKTRLAIEVTRAAEAEFADRGAFVELVAVRAEFLVQAVAAALDVPGGAGETLDEAVREQLASRNALLVLDNCEHLLAAVADFVGRLLAACPKVHVLVTSRERLGVPGERLIGVPPLATIFDADSDGDTTEATQLFVDRARALDAGFDDDPDAVAQLCAELDGMPLAIELAAARVHSLGAAGLLAGLGDRLRLLSGGRNADARHRSLRSVLDWSHGLLDDEERRMLRRLGAFVGSFDLASAAFVATDGDEAAAADLLGRLTDKSLVVHQRGAASRWRLLEIVRTYALAKLADSFEEEAIRARHVAWAVQTAVALESRLDDDPGWRADFDAVGDDLRAAIANSAGRPGAHELAMSTAHLVFAHRFYEEALAHYEGAATRAPDTPAAVQAMRMAADTCQATIHTSDAFDRFLRAAELAATCGDDATRAICLAQAVIIANRFPAGMREDVPHDRLSALLDEARRVAPPDDLDVTGHIAQASAWNVTAATLTVEPVLADRALAAARATADPVLISGALDAVLSALLSSGRMRAAFELSLERMANRSALSRYSPRAAIELTDTMHMLNEQALAAGELPTALREMRRVQDDDAMAFVGYNALSKLMVGLTLTGRLDAAVSTAGELWTGWVAAGSPTARWMSPAVLAAALAHGLLGHAADVDTWLQRAQLIIGEHSLVTHRHSGGFARFTIARLAMHAGRVDDALAATRGYCAGIDSWYGTDQHWFYDAYVWALDAELSVLAGSRDAEARLAASTPVAAENRWAAACLDRARGRLTGDAGALRRSIAGWEAIDARFERAATLLLLPERAAEGRAELVAIGAPVPS